MSLTRATPDQIQKQIGMFTGLADGGQWAFQLVCFRCGNIKTISVKGHEFKSAKSLKKAAKKYAAQGWWVDHDQLICPDCYIDHYP